MNELQFDNIPAVDPSPQLSESIPTGQDQAELIGRITTAAE